jgi:hypothetical protein
MAGCREIARIRSSFIAKPVVWEVPKVVHQKCGRAHAGIANSTRKAHYRKIGNSRGRQLLFFPHPDLGINRHLLHVDMHPQLRFDSGLAGAQHPKKKPKHRHGANYDCSSCFSFGIFPN